MKRRELKFHFYKIYTAPVGRYRPGDRLREDVTLPSFGAFLLWVSDVNYTNAQGKLPYRVEV